MSSSPRSAPGFSLVELMIVVVVLGIALTASAPFMGGYFESKSLQDSVTDLASRLEFARSRAVTEQNWYRVILDDPAPEKYRVHADDNNDGNIDAGEDVLGPFSLPAGVQFQSINLLAGGDITFAPSGTLTAGQGGTIIISDDQGRQLTLEVYNSGLTQTQTTP